MKTAFITGNSSGLGLGLTEELLDLNYDIYGISRRGCPVESVHDTNSDLTDFDTTPQKIKELLKDVTHLDVVFLNAGALGDIKDMSNTSIDELKTLMDINVWSYKVVLDTLLEMKISIDQIILTSSGAAVLGNRGWGGYALTKAALNMIGRLYSHEFPQTHIVSLAPGLIDSSMTKYLCNEVNSSEFSAVQRIKEAKKNGVMLSPHEAAQRMISVLGRLKKFESGSFVDIRQILAPEEYQAMMDARNR